MSQAALDIFGELLITRVRDEAISDWNMIIDGRMKDDASARVREALAIFTPEQKSIVLSLIPQVVDTVLHHLLWTLEQYKNIRVGVTTDTGDVPNLKEISDGLAGELYSENGWISRFSKEKG